MRIENRALLDSFHRKRCLVCGVQGCDPDHIISRGAGGDDVESNLWPLCRRHHSERHQIGIMSFIRKYRGLELTLRLKGWRVQNNKLIRPGP